MAQNNTTCNMSPEFWYAKDCAFVVTYYILTPLYLIFGTSGSVINVAAFFQQRKNENAYAYQTVNAFNEAVQAVAAPFTIMMIKWWSGMEGAGAQWFTSQYSVMWYCAHGGRPLLNTCLTLSVLLNLCMAVDRVFALWKPFAYKNFNHKRRAFVAITGCAVLSAATNIFDMFRYEIYPTDLGGYVVRLNENYVSSGTANVWAQLRNVVRSVAVVALIWANVLMVKLYRNRGKVVSHMTIANKDNSKEAQRKASETTLILITLCQSGLTSVAMIVIIAFYITVYSVPGFAACGGVLFNAFSDGIIEICHTLEFYIVFAINKQFRKMVAEAIPLCGRFAQRSSG